MTLPISDLVDDFNDNNFNTSLWYSPPLFFTPEEVNQRLEFTNSTGNGYWITSNDRYNLLGGLIKFRLELSVGQHKFIINSADIYSSFLCHYTVYISPTLIYIYTDTDEILWLDTYNNIYKYFRAREDGGLIYFEASINEIDWIFLALDNYVTSNIPLDNVFIEFKHRNSTNAWMDSVNIDENIIYKKLLMKMYTH